MTTPYRRPSELATTDPTVPLAPARYVPIGRRAWTIGIVAVPFALYIAIAAAIFADVFVGFAAMGGVFVALLALIVVVVRRRRRLLALVRRNDDAIALLGAGKADEAGRTLDALIAASRTQPLWNSVFVLHRALAFMRQGELARARTLLASVDDAGWMRSPMVVGFNAMLASSQAWLAALAGDLDDAERRVARLRAALSAAKAGMVLATDAVILLRRGRAGEVVGLIDGAWLDAEGSLSAHQLRTVRLLRAFALSSQPDADAEALRDTLAGARPFRPGEFDYLVAAWPELGAFLAEHGFVAAAR